MFSRTCDTKFNDLNLANLPKSIESKLKKVLGNNILPHLDKAATPERKCSHKDGDSEFVKKCKQASRLFEFDSFSGQKWKLNDNMLENKAGLWRSVDSWIFKTKDDDRLIYIENTSKAKVLENARDGEVIQEVFVEGKADQLWKKGEPDAEGYFTLRNSGEPKVLTAISESSLEIIGMR